MPRRQSIHGHWSSRLAFVLAASGSAVGLGNIWRFPYITGEQGGGAFVLVYLLCVALVGLPVMMAEVLLGRRGRRNPIESMRMLSEEESGSGKWRLVGVLGVITGLLILSYYAVIASWTLAYVVEAARGAFTGADAATSRQLFEALEKDPLRMLAWFTLFLATAGWIVARGVAAGLERAVKLFMPLLLVLLLALVGYSLTTGDAGAAFAFLFDFGSHAIDGQMLLVAMGQAFFALSVGMGALMAYAAYLPQQTSIGGTAVTVAAANTVVSLLAGLIVFPLVFAHGLEAGQGPALVFHTLPIAFGQIPGGGFVGALFFLLLVFAALMSTLALLEPAVVWLVEQHDLRRGVAAFAVCGFVWLLGLATVASFGDVALLRLPHGGWYDMIEHATSNVLLPLGGLLIALFAGWVMCKNSTVEELDMGVGLRYDLWRMLLRFVAPLVLGFVLVCALGLCDAR